MTYDLIDKIYTPTGVMLTDADGNEYPEMVAIDGYHVNILDYQPTYDENGVCTNDITPYIVQVATPKRVFAGRRDAINLKFIDRAEWLSLGIEKEEIV